MNVCCCLVDVVMYGEGGFGGVKSELIAAQVALVGVVEWRGGGDEEEGGSWLIISVCGKRSTVNTQFP
jgi:hypothetical protein